MQRIDENTYIDDTLVTCAEYQLFIDEMREQGKYYQPDHWTSDQFLNGQAREPILGVRLSDANAFCDWLTRYGEQLWRYRLPTMEETRTQLMEHPSIKRWGYWTSTLEHGVSFWGKGFEFNDYEGGILFYGEPFSHFMYPLNINLPRTQETDKSTVLDFIENEITKLLQLLLPVFDLLEKAITNSMMKYFGMTKSQAHERYKVLKIELDGAYRGKTVTDYKFGEMLSAHLDTGLIYRQAQAISPEFTRTALSLYCLILMKERLLGDYPALEGIRLVKYRE